MKRDRRPPDQDEPLQRQIETIRRRLDDMQDDSPPADAKAQRVRFEFIEQRIQELERMAKALRDIVEVMTDQAAAHLMDRHQTSVEDTRSPDTIHIRRARQMLRAAKPRAEAPNDPSAPSVQKK